MAYLAHWPFVPCVISQISIVAKKHKNSLVVSCLPRTIRENKGEVRVPRCRPGAKSPVGLILLEKICQQYVCTCGTPYPEGNTAPLLPF
eukprot:scaffold117_cov99-Isochrysis_galbana.AAC.6